MLIPFKHNTTLSYDGGDGCLRLNLIEQDEHTMLIECQFNRKKDETKEQFLRRFAIDILSSQQLR